MLSGDLAFAAAAGTLAAVNPCGFAMLPAYLVLFGRTDTVSPLAAVGRALESAAVLTAGFVAVFGAFGLLLTPVAGTVQRWAPVLTVAIGLLLAVLGVLTLAGRKVSLRLPGVRIPGLTGGQAEDGRLPARVMFSYGVAYAVTSLGCAIGPFLAVVATTLRSGDLGTGMAACLVYALGMGSVVALLAVTLALARQSAARPLRRLAPFTRAAGGVLVVTVGAYVTWFGVYEIRVRAGADADDRVVAGAGSVQSVLVRWIDALGPPVVVLALLAVVGLAFGLRDRRGSPR